MEFAELMENVARGFEMVGVAIITIGGAAAIVVSLFREPNAGFFEHARRRFGRPLILGLEVLVAADIIETITVDRTLEGTAALGLLVLVRVVLSFSLDVEIEGMMPWRRAQFERAVANDAQSN